MRNMTRALEPTIRRPRKPTVMDGVRRRPDERYTGGSCLRGRHCQCFTLRCSCACHKGGLR